MLHPASLVNELGGRIRPTQIELRVGRAPHTTPWGVRARQRELRAWRDWSLEASIEVWRQPPVALDADESLSSSPRTGVHVRGRVERPFLPLWFSADRATIVVDVGVKSAGSW
jgi:hypothetical protein